MPGQFIESQPSIVSQNHMESLKCASLGYIYGFIVLNYWWNSESVTQLTQKKISKQVAGYRNGSWIVTW